MSVGMERRLHRLEAQWTRRQSQSTLRPCPQWMEDGLRQHNRAAGLTSDAAASHAEWQYQALPAQREFHCD
jgi:hypothetical protein